MNTLIKLALLLTFALIWIGPAVYFEAFGLLFFTWIPGVAVCAYLEPEEDENGRFIL